MDISVILPTYNCESTIKSTIESVINQTHNKIELIIFDDCSSDQISENT
jgi:glycosyltransferase involved in cell wall biosynthesis